MRLMCIGLSMRWVLNCIKYLIKKSILFCRFWNKGGTHIPKNFLFLELWIRMLKYSLAICSMENCCPLPYSIWKHWNSRNRLLSKHFISIQKPLTFISSKRRISIRYLFIPCSLCSWYAYKNLIYPYQSSEDYWPMF